MLTLLSLLQVRPNFCQVFMIRKNFTVIIRAKTKSREKEKETNIPKYIKNFISLWNIFGCAEQLLKKVLKSSTKNWILSPRTFESREQCYKWALVEQLIPTIMHLSIWYLFVAMHSGFIHPCFHQSKRPVKCWVCFELLCVGACLHGCALMHVCVIFLSSEC